MHQQWKRCDSSEVETSPTPPENSQEQKKEKEWKEKTSQKKNFKKFVTEVLE